MLCALVVAGVSKECDGIYKMACMQKKSSRLGVYRVPFLPMCGLTPDLFPSSFPSEHDKVIDAASLRLNEVFPTHADALGAPELLVRALPYPRADEDQGDGMIPV